MQRVAGAKHFSISKEFLLYQHQARHSDSLVLNTFQYQRNFYSTCGVAYHFGCIGAKHFSISKEFLLDRMPRFNAINRRC